MSTLLAASMACADPLDYRAATLRLDAAGVDVLHFDLCDGHFAPTFLLAPGLIKALRPLTRARCDAHLYCTHPARYLRELHAAGADVVITHMEAAQDPAAVVEQILDLGMRAGIGLLPGTPVPPALAALLPKLTLVIANMVGPAYAGQPFDARGLENAHAVAAMARRLGLDLEIAADGHVCEESLPELLAAGCTHLICGTSSIFRPQQDLGEALRRFRAVVAHAAQAQPG